MKTNIYHVIWDNGQPWPEDHSEQHTVATGTDAEQVIKENAGFWQVPVDQVEAILVLKDVEIPD